MDKLDKEILEQLQESYALVPKVTEIAKRIGKSSATVHSRIKRMEKKGVIKGYTAILDPEKIGKKLNAFYFIKVHRGIEEGLEDKTVEALLKMSEVKNVYWTMGEWDLVVEVAVEDASEYIKFARKIEPLPGVKESKGKSVLKTYPSKYKL
ncbi:MAG: Lrp/AsnC family transcriptional regulator [Candidatus Altiarchaeota archaeon]|nr:Lrp/AsnC family transcriptional regulator [Candidatus Altiarchaeota archaeon]